MQTKQALALLHNIKQAHPNNSDQFIAGEFADRYSIRFSGWDRAYTTARGMLAHPSFGGGK